MRLSVYVEDSEESARQEEICGWKFFTRFGLKIYWTFLMEFIIKIIGNSKNLERNECRCYQSNFYLNKCFNKIISYCRYHWIFICLLKQKKFLK